MGPLVTSTPGQHLLVDFDAAASVTAVCGGVLFDAPFGATVTTGGAQMTVVTTDGRELVSGWLSAPDGRLDMGPFPETASYTLRIEPAGADVVTLALPLTSAATAQAAVDGDPVRVATTVPGQAARVTFPGAAGQALSIGFQDSVFSRPDGVAVRVFDPNGSVLADRWVSGDDNLDLPPLAAAGDVVVLFRPGRPLTFGLGVAVSTPVMVALAVEAAPVTVGTVRAGQDLRGTFEADAGRLLTVALAAAGLDAEMRAALSRGASHWRSTTAARSSSTGADPGVGPGLPRPTSPCCAEPQRLRPSGLGSDGLCTIDALAADAPAGFKAINTARAGER